MQLLHLVALGLNYDLVSIHHLVTQIACLLSQVFIVFLTAVLEQSMSALLAKYLG
jgi:hypothetical protein